MVENKKVSFASKLIPEVINIAKKAAAIHQFYYAALNVPVHIKSDNSPVTEADMKAHDFITKSLYALNKQWPILSEEGIFIPYVQRKQWNTYWLIDPLDGTKEFINKTGDFTVNIALIENHIPVLGVVAVPELKEYYWALKNTKAYWESPAQGIQEIQVNTTPSVPLRVALSKHHTHFTLLKQLLSHVGEYEEIVCGSTLKMCLVARGNVDLYPRFGPTGEWDTAAGQCIIEAAGGKVIDLNGNPLEYNRKAHLINPDFIAGGCLTEDFLKTLKII